MSNLDTLPDSSFIVLALLTEGEIHGYDLEKKVHTRGFRFWTRLGRTSIYSSLKKLEKEKLIKSRMESAGGPARKVFSITEAGIKVLKTEGAIHLTTPAHPRSELDLGLYAIPLLNPNITVDCWEQCLSYLKKRRSFIKERFEWCTTNGLDLPALSFERTMLMLDAEISWIKKTKSKIAKKQLDLSYKGWQNYEYKEPPDS
ncbi:MAG: PadR family transcriptional regulator [Bdellovibrionota bacterium]